MLAGITVVLKTIPVNTTIVVVGMQACRLQLQSVLGLTGLESGFFGVLFMLFSAPAVLRSDCMSSG